MAVLKITPSIIKGGTVKIPGSKSHMIRGLFLGLLAKGQSRLEEPLFSGDTNSAVEICRALGAAVETFENRIEIEGCGARLKAPAHTIDVGNSGTSLYIGLSVAALADGQIIFTGDEQIRSRPAKNLLNALQDLGAKAESVKGNGCAPIKIMGPLKGGKTSIECPTSQYLSSLLLATPLCPQDTEISVPLLNEVPYVEMTLRWLDEQKIRYEKSPDLKHFKIFGGQQYQPFRKRIPADFSSGTFFAVLAAISGAKITLDGLDMNDSQGDRKVIDILRTMGTKVEIGAQSITLTGQALMGGIFDLNDIPDSLPALAVAACFAKGRTMLGNVAHARLKETDRIKLMAQELSKMGAKIEERPDGLLIENSPLKGATLSGHSDHRIVMALALAATQAQGSSTVDTAESAAITFPNFADLLTQVGGQTQIV